MSAVISPCGRYRYWLSREGDATKHPIAFIMLNPSTADASKDDATIRRLYGFAKGAPFVVVNLMAYRATKPDDMLRAEDPIGPDNDYYLHHIADGRTIVCAWGDLTDMRVVSRARWVTAVLRQQRLKLYCLGTTKLRGWPRHPLYVKGDQPLVEYAP